MTGLIKRNEAALTATAGKMSALSTRASAIGTQLDAAVRPARRSDVPELGEIEAIYGAVRARISNSAISLDIQARDLRDYVQASILVEQLNAMLFKRAALAQFLGATLQVGAAKFGWVGLAGNLSKTALEEAVSRSGTHLIDNGGPAVSIGFTRVAGRLLFLWSMTNSVRGLAGNNDAVDNFNDSVNLASGFVVLAAGFDKLLVGAGARSAVFAPLAGAAELVLPVTVGATIGTVVGRWRADQISALEARGLDPVKVASAEYAQAMVQGGPMPGANPKVLKANYNLITAELATNDWIGKHVFGAEDPVPNDYLNNYSASVVLAGIREQFPGANVAQLGEGTYIIRIPNLNGMPAYSIEFDNKTGKVVRL